MNLQTVFINCLYLLGITFIVLVVVYTILYTIINLKSEIQSHSERGNKNE